MMNDDDGNDNNDDNEMKIIGLAMMIRATRDVK